MEHVPWLRFSTFSFLDPQVVTEGLTICNRSFYGHHQSTMSDKDIEVKDADDVTVCYQPCKDLACEYREAFGEHWHKIVLKEDVTQFWSDETNPFLDDR
jgi:hypothetical protein